MNEPLLHAAIALAARCAERAVPATAEEARAIADELGRAHGLGSRDRAELFDAAERFTDSTPAINDLALRLRGSLQRMRWPSHSQGDPVLGAGDGVAAGAAARDLIATGTFAGPASAAPEVVEPPPLRRRRPSLGALGACAGLILSFGALIWFSYTPSSGPPLPVSPAVPALPLERNAEPSFLFPVAADAGVADAVPAVRPRAPVPSNAVEVVPSAPDAPPVMLPAFSPGESSPPPPDEPAPSPVAPSGPSAPVIVARPAPILPDVTRLSGDEEIAPDEVTMAAMSRAHQSKVTGSFKVCITVSGEVSSVTALRSTGFPSYDARILSTIRASWRYRPYLVAGRPAPVCTAVVFVYQQQ